ncbi:MAG TPA: hypothetical protein VMB81_01460 [Candidatus Sulfotelmatobacter sp.]|nr:hypothetical protein [Candidatus Sulfotelmatobacter sp.]
MTAALTGRLNTLLLASLIALTLLGALTGIAVFSVAGAACWLAFALLAVTTLSRAEAVLLSVAASVGVLVAILAAHPVAVMLHGLAQGAAYASLVLALSFVQAPAEGAPMVRRCGTYLIQQGPGRRYLALTAGAHLFGSVLNLGAIALLGSMIEQSNTLEAAGGDARVREIRHRRMATALLRGFGTTTLWSTGSVAPSVMLAMFPAVSWLQLAANGLLLAVVMMALGWVLDRLQWSRATRIRAVVVQSTDTAVGALLPMVALVAAMVTSVVAIKQVFGLSLSIAVVLVVPLAATIWLLVQYRSLAVTVRLLGRHCTVRLPRMRWEVLGLGSAGFIGTGIAALVPPDALPHLLDALALPPAVLLIAASALMLGIGQIGINPIVASTILGGALSHLAHTSVPPMALITALMGPWTLYAMTSPFAASVIMAARVAETTPATLGQVWNGWFLLLSFAVSSAMVVALVALG